MAKRKRITEARIRAFIGEEAYARHERVQRQLAEFSAHLKRKELEGRRGGGAQQAS